MLSGASRLWKATTADASSGRMGRMPRRRTVFEQDVHVPRRRVLRECHHPTMPCPSVVVQGRRSLRAVAGPSRRLGPALPGGSGPSRNRIPPAPGRGPRPGTKGLGDGSHVGTFSPVARQVEGTSWPEISSVTRRCPMAGELTGDTIGAAVIGSHDRPVRTFQVGRTCGEEGCGARLSIYNSSDRCSLHPRFETLPCVGRPTGSHSPSRPKAQRCSSRQAA